MALIQRECPAAAKLGGAVHIISRLSDVASNTSNHTECIFVVHKYLNEGKKNNNVNITTIYQFIQSTRFDTGSILCSLTAILLMSFASS